MLAFVPADVYAPGSVSASSFSDRKRFAGLLFGCSFGFPGSFPRRLADSGEYALRNRFYLQYGFTAVIET